MIQAFKSQIESAKAQIAKLGKPHVKVVAPVPKVGPPKITKISNKDDKDDERVVSAPTDSMQRQTIQDDAGGKVTMLQGNAQIGAMDDDYGYYQDVMQLAESSAVVEDDNDNE